MTKKQFSTKLMHAIILTVFTAGSIHLAAVFIASVVHNDLWQMNPINILGLQFLFPEWVNSGDAFVIGWTVLVCMAVLYLFLLIHYKRYIAIISATTPYQKVQHIHQTAKKTIKKQIDTISAKNHD